MLENRIRTYPWGSYTAIADLLGEKSPSDEPQAELWMGTHPSAPSLVRQNNTSVPLTEFIRRNPEDILGKDVCKKFDHQLPFLFKILAVENPLSIQVHPDIHQARKGFESENHSGIPLDSARRNYKDKNHKPECICAVSDFQALNGFRSATVIADSMEKCGGGILANEISILKKDPGPEGLKQFVRGLMMLSSHKKKEIIATVAGNTKNKMFEDPACQWIQHFHRIYGDDDIGVLSPLLLNFICLKPGQALFIFPGEPHAYLKGTGIELMANSDNVIRGGLTSKHTDIREFIRIADFRRHQTNILLPEKTGEGEWVYPAHAEEFLLSRIQVGKEIVYQSRQDRSVEILICLEGSASILDIKEDEKTVLKMGTSILIPSAVEKYTIQGEAVIYKASVPLELLPETSHRDQ